MSNRIVVVGGGASGMMAAIVAQSRGFDVTILERNDRVGKKLLATGNGRCNYTNENIDLRFFHGEDKELIK
ncbi:MAG TPA: FAD-dependent oxidoreductase, partial [Tissierellaceae bacterium]|nr:FAD-dependent oxidoreductase [Tissierellaceae bacterium]